MKLCSEGKTKSNSWRVGIAGFCLLAILLALFYWIVADSWAANGVSQSFSTRQKVLPDLVNQTVVEQKINFPGNQLDSLVIYPNIPQEIEGTLTAEIRQGESVLARSDAALSSFLNMEAATLAFEQAQVPANIDLSLVLTVNRPEDGKYFSLFYGDTVDIGRYQLTASDVDGLMVEGEAYSGHLDMELTGVLNSQVMGLYIYVFAGILLVYILLFIWVIYCKRIGKRNVLLIIAQEARRYRFLVERLVSRDFNTKYRQSILGVLWSFLNPLLTMLVQYVVFSTLFKSNIDNFIVYLLSGIVMFNFFSEATNMGVESITSNASLINKVYVPKYVYPFSRLLSSGVNLLISLIPLMIVVVATGLPITKAFLLIPLPLIFLAAFSLGISFLLSTCNVFFRDTKFLWSVLILMWNFLTPIFYPESIIPASMLKIYHMNPLYQFIYFMRCILLEGVTPQPITYLYCLLCSIIPLLLGVWVFRRNQNRFVLHL